MSAENPQPIEYKADMERVNNPEVPVTGIPVRAKINNSYEPVDIAHLDRESLLDWLRSRDDMGLEAGAKWRENIILLCFGHEQQV
jgi:hypothetical protein